MLIRALILSLASLIALPASAESERTILVLDGSGSMWGQIENENKIVIARKVMGDLLDTLPDDLELGLTVYGHRRKGDCTDIESIVAPAAGTREAIRKAVNAINPKGKTPLSAAVLAAAEELKYGEEKATVILVSDGRETCDIDPCELGKKLEETGVDFTAHVIGFDVSEVKDRAQLRCLAENTGGKFLSAANASELSDALQQVSAPPPPPPPFILDMRATEGEGGPRIAEGLVWTVTALEDDATLLQSDEDASPTLEADPSTQYRVEVLRIDDEATAETTFRTGSEGRREVVLVLDTPLPDATVSGPETATVSLPIEVEWTGPAEKHDHITIAEPGSDPGQYLHAMNVSKGSPLRLDIPGTPGNYELRYMLAKPRTVLATQAITVEDAPTSVLAPEVATMGATIEVEWTGPDAQNDFIAIAAVDADGNKHVNYTYTRSGSPLKLLMPAAPGDYEIRYILSKDRRILAKRAIAVEQAEVSVTAPETAPIGSTVNVEWVGPDAQNDLIAVAKPDDEGNKHVNYTYTRTGSPLKLLMPSQPGEYEIRYILSQDRSVQARQAITIEEAEVSVSAPETATIGSTVKVEWVGPDAKNDYVAVANTDDEDNKHVNYTYTRTGSPLKLLMPSTPGDYEIRYVLSQDRSVLARQPITIEEAEVGVSAPDTATIGSTVKVEWTGPDARNDYIAVANTDDEDNKHVNYTYTRKGSPLKLLMPATPGDYEIRYVLSQDRSVLARQTIAVEEAAVSVSAPETAEAGYTVKVEWTGPDAQGDYIAVAKPDDAGNKQIGYVRTRDGSPLKLEMPAEPGDYEIRYILNQSRRILARQPITIEAATVTLDAKDTVKPEANLSVDWTGPNGSGDYIAIALPNMEAKKHLTYKRVSGGSPILLKAPVVPSTYELRYVLKKSNAILARRTLVVE